MLVKCPDCGTLVSDKAAKCPKCGKSMSQQSPVEVEYNGIIKVLNKALEVQEKFPNFRTKVEIYPDNFSIDPIVEVIPKQNGDKSFNIQVDIAKLKQLNAIPAFEALVYHSEFTVKDDSSLISKVRTLNNQGAKLEAIKVYKEATGIGLKEAIDFVDSLDYTTSQNSRASGNCIGTTTVSDAKMASKIACDLITLVFKKSLSAIRLNITGIGDNSDFAKYNSNGDFIEGTGYGQGEFAYYKDNSSERDSEIDDDSDDNTEDSPNAGLKAISFLFPIVGWILWGINKGQYPNKAKACSKWAWIGFGVSLLISIIIR